MATVSAAERSFEGGRARRFDASEIVAFSLVFGFPISYFFLPPDLDDGYDRFITSDHEAGDSPPPTAAVLHRDTLAEAIDPFYPPEEHLGRLGRLNAERHVHVAPGSRVHVDTLSADQASRRTEVSGQFGGEPTIPGPTGP